MAARRPPPRAEAPKPTIEQASGLLLETPRKTGLLERTMKRGERVVADAAARAVSDAVASLRPLRAAGAKTFNGLEPIKVIAWLRTEAKRANARGAELHRAASMIEHAIGGGR